MARGLGVPGRCAFPYHAALLGYGLDGKAEGSVSGAMGGEGCGGGGWEGWGWVCVGCVCL